MQRALTLVAAGLATLALASGQAVADQWLDERAFLSESLREMTTYVNTTLDGNEAVFTRQVADTDSDGNVSAAEAREFQERVRRIVSDETSELQTRIDDLAPTTALANFTLTGMEGSANSTAPIQRSSEFRLTFDIVGGTTHTFSRTPAGDESGVTWTVRVPDGFEIHDSAGLTNVTKIDARTLSGVPGSAEVLVQFGPPRPPTPETNATVRPPAPSDEQPAFSAPTPTPNPALEESARGVPSVGVWGFVVAVVGVALLVRRPR